jgi:hypothetical protein
MLSKKKRIPIPNKTKALLQQEINSSCPFCSSTDVDHFEFHHIDEDPSNNDFSNLLMLCPTCHSKITKGDITKEAVLLKKQSLKKRNTEGDFHQMFSFKEAFQNELKKLIDQDGSVYYKEIKEHWNSYSLIDGCPFLDELLNKSLSKSIEFGLLPLISDIVSKHLYYDKDAKYLYNQPHIYMHNSEDEGYDLPAYYHIHLVGILYATAIRNKIDVHTVARNYRNMQTIYSTMIAGMIDNLSLDGVDNTKEYPTNYHWLIREIFHNLNNWLCRFNEKENFVRTSSYIDFIPFNFSLCLSELYKGEQRKKIDKQFVVNQCYYNVLSEYFWPPLNNLLRIKIEEKIITEIPNYLIKPILDFSLDEGFAVNYEDFCEGDFRIINNSEREILNRLRNFLISNNKI